MNPVCYNIQRKERSSTLLWKTFYRTGNVERSIEQSTWGTNKKIVLGSCHLSPDLLLLDKCFSIVFTNFAISSDTVSYQINFKENTKRKLKCWSSYYWIWLDRFCFFIVMLSIKRNIRKLIIVFLTPNRCQELLSEQLFFI